MGSLSFMNPPTAGISSSTAETRSQRSDDDWAKESPRNSPLSALFPSRGSSELFATCSEEDIRLWHVDKPKELLRITVPNMTCNSVDLMADGHSIVSGETTLGPRPGGRLD